MSEVITIVESTIYSFQKGVQAVVMKVKLFSKPFIGYKLAEGSTCTSDKVTLVDKAPESWSGLNCLLMPSKVYNMEEANIRVQWCMDNESECSKLPEGMKSKF